MDKNKNTELIVTSNEEKKESVKKKGIFNKHMLMMIICCGLPIILIAFISILNINTSGIVDQFIWLLCPLLMIPMMFLMFRKNKNNKSGCCDDESIENNTN